MGVSTLPTCYIQAVTAPKWDICFLNTLLLLLCRVLSLARYPSARDNNDMQ